MRDNSKCSKNFLCDFKSIGEHPDAYVEICTNCAKKVIYNKDENGRIDNAQYARDHIRDILQPFGSTAKLFEKIYGRTALIKAQELRAIPYKKSKRDPDRKRKYVTQTGAIEPSNAVTTNK